MASYIARLEAAQKGIDTFYSLLNLYKLSKLNNGWVGSENTYSNMTLSDFNNYIRDNGYTNVPDDLNVTFFDIPAMSRGYNKNGKYSAGIPSDIGFTKNVENNKCHEPLYEVSASRSARGYASIGADTEIGGYIDYSFSGKTLNIIPNGSQTVLEDIGPTSPYWKNSEKFIIIPVEGSNHMHLLYAFVSADINNGGLVLYVTPNFVNWNIHQIIPTDITPTEFVDITGQTIVNYDVNEDSAVIIKNILKKYFRVLPNNNYLIMYPIDMYRGNNKSTMVKMYSPWNSDPILTIKDPYNTTRAYKNKAINGFSSYLTDNGEIVLYYNNRSETPLILYNGKIMGTYSSDKYLNYNKEIVNTPKIAKFYDMPLTTTSGCEFDVMDTSIECGISILESKNTSLSNDDIPAAYVNISLGDCAKNIYANTFDSINLLVEDSIDMMDNIDVDFSNYISTSFVNGEEFRSGDVDMTNNGIFNASKLKLNNAGRYRNNVRYRSTVFGNTLYNEGLKLTNNPSLSGIY